MSWTRRSFVKQGSMSLAALGTIGMSSGATGTCRGTELSAKETKGDRDLIVDTHQHLWDISKLRLPWLEGSDAVLNRTMHLKEYAEATEGLPMRSIYMEVDVDEKQLRDEAQHILEICRSGGGTVAAVLGGRPDAADFKAYLDFLGNAKELKGLRRVLHSPATPAGYCLRDSFVAGVRELGKRGLRFDLCMRPSELADACKLTELCPDTQFTLDHCGNGNPAAFKPKKDDKAPAPHSADDWKKQIEKLSVRPNVICKISGVIASLPKGGDASDIAPIINHCLDAFGEDRVVFGSDWPVCLLGAPLKTWVEYLTQIISDRSETFRRKLWSENAIKHYALK